MRRFRDDSGDDLVSLAEFHGLSGMEPGLELPGVTKLADIYLGHISSWHEMWHIVKGQGAKSEYRALLSFDARRLNPESVTDALRFSQARLEVTIRAILDTDLVIPGVFG